LKNLFKYTFFVSVIIIISIFFVSNVQQVSVNLVPPNFLEDTILFSAPLFVVMILFTVLGLSIGYCSEYLRSSKTRKIAKQSKKVAERLNIEVKTLKSKVNSESDEILNYLK
jgi:uncharacterized integral membrane protein